MRILIFLAILIGLQSCAPFKKGLSNDFPLQTNNLNLLDGKYEIISQEKAKDSTTPQYYRCGNLLEEIDRKEELIWRNKDLSENIIEIKTIGNTVLEINFLKNDQVLKRKRIKTELTSDGYLYLENDNVENRGVPFVFGGIGIKRIRFTLTKEKNLVVDVSHFEGGAALFFILLDWDLDQYRYTYKRVQ